MRNVRWVRMKVKDQEGAPWHMQDGNVTLCKKTITALWDLFPSSVPQGPHPRMRCRECVQAATKQRSRVRVGG